MLHNWQPCLHGYHYYYEIKFVGQLQNLMVMVNLQALYLTTLYSATYIQN